MRCTYCHNTLRLEDRADDRNMHKKCKNKYNMDRYYEKVNRRTDSGLSESDKEHIRNETCWQYEDSIYM